MTRDHQKGRQSPTTTSQRGLSWSRNNTHTHNIQHTADPFEATVIIIQSPNKVKSRQDKKEGKRKEKAKAKAAVDATNPESRILSQVIGGVGGGGVIVLQSPICVCPSCPSGEIILKLHATTTPILIGFQPCRLHSTQPHLARDGIVKLAGKGGGGRIKSIRLYNMCG